MSTPGLVDQDGKPVDFHSTSSVYNTLGVTGLTGAVANSRWAGATSSGAPTSGTFYAGDFIIDGTGNIWVCTVGGTSGTWVQVGTALTGSANGALVGAGPAANGYLAWTCDLLTASSTMTFASSTNVYVAQIYVPLACTTTYADVNCTANSTGTVTHAYAGIYNLAGTQLALSADIHTAWGTGTGKQTFTWATPAALTPGFYYVALEAAWTTATPTLAAATANTGINFNVAANTERYSLYGTSATLPASLTPATVVTGAAVTAMPWVAIY